MSQESSPTRSPSWRWSTWWSSRSCVRPSAAPGAGGRRALSVDIRSKAFGSGAARREVIRGLRFSAAAGEVLALVGPSGCGKTTTLRAVAGLDRDYDGAIGLPAGAHGGEPVVSFVFQEPRLLPWRRVRENVEIVLPRALRGGGRADEALRDVGLEGAGNQFPGELSGGMQRRAALARAFVTEPDLLLLDEPFISLDEATAGRLRALLAAMLARRNVTTLLVTHDLREAAELADRVVLLSGPPARIVETLDVPSKRGQRSPEMIEEFRRRMIEEGNDVPGS